MSLQDNLRFAEEAVTHARSWQIRATNRPDELATLEERGIGLKRTRDAIELRENLNHEFVQRDQQRALDGLPRRGVKHTELGIVLHRAYVAQANGFGNCEEQACIAFRFLFERKPKCRPIELMKFSLRKDLSEKWDHCWVVIGKDQKAEDGKLSTWGPEAVWCDPWQDYGKFFSVQDFIDKKVRFSNLALRFHLFTVQEVEAGMPKSWIRKE